MTAARKRRKLLRLWEQSPLCHWCGILTVVILRTKFHNEADRCPVRNDEATLDHLFTRLSVERAQVPTNGGSPVVLACWRCNNDRNKQDQADTPLAVRQMLARMTSR